MGIDLWPQRTICNITVQNIQNIRMFCICCRFRLQLIFSHSPQHYNGMEFFYYHSVDSLVLLIYCDCYCVFIKNEGCWLAEHMNFALLSGAARNPLEKKSISTLKFSTKFLCDNMILTFFNK